MPASFYTQRHDFRHSSRSIIDCAVGPNFISEELASKFQIPQLTFETRISGIGSAVVNVNKKMNSRIAPYQLNFEAVVV